MRSYSPAKARSRVCVSCFKAMLSPLSRAITIPLSFRRLKPRGEVGAGLSGKGAEIRLRTRILFISGIEWIIASIAFAFVSVDELRLCTTSIPLPVCRGGNLSESERWLACPVPGLGPMGLGVGGPMKSGRGRLGRRCCGAENVKGVRGP